MEVIQRSSQKSRFLTEEQLNKLNTVRLNKLRKSLSHTVNRMNALHFERGDYGGDIDEFNSLNEYYQLIKKVLNTREHIEK